MATIQELIKKYSTTKDAQVCAEIKERIKTEEKLFVAFCPATKNYYLGYEMGTPAAYIFTQKEYFDSYNDYDGVEVKAAELPIETRKQFFGDLFRSGFEVVIVDNGQTYLGINIAEFVEKPDFTGVPEVKRPVLNPTLVRNANNFFQELSVGKATPELQAEMFRSIYEARFIMPMDSSKLKTNTVNSDTGESVIMQDSLIAFPVITNAAGKKFYMFYSDWNELARYDREHKYSGMITTFDDMKHFNRQADGVVINPFGANIILTTEMLDSVQRVSESVPVTVQEVVAKKDEKVLIGEPAEYPHQLANVLSAYLRTQKSVKSAYLRLMMRGDEKNYLIVVDFDGDKEELFNGMANEAVRISRDIPVSFVTLSEEFGKNAAEGAEPFYKKKFSIFGK